MNIITAAASTIASAAALISTNRYIVPLPISNTLKQDCSEYQSGLKTPCEDVINHIFAEPQYNITLITKYDKEINFKALRIIKADGQHSLEFITDNIEVIEQIKNDITCFCDNGMFHPYNFIIDQFELRNVFARSISYLEYNRAKIEVMFNYMAIKNTKTKLLYQPEVNQLTEIEKIMQEIDVWLQRPEELFDRKLKGEKTYL
jgi:hypothetical protein